MAQEVPQLFSPVKSAILEARAQRMGAEPFLLDHAVQDLAERLATILRPLPDALDLLSPFGAFGHALKAAGKGENTAFFREDWQDALGEAAQYDAILSGMALHIINDLPGLLAASCRALRPDGLFLAAFPGGDTLRELREVLLNAEADLRGAAALRVLPMVDVRQAGQLLQRAGFALPVVDREVLTLRYASLFHLVRDLRAMASTATLLAGTRPPLTRAILARADALYRERYSGADGRITATIEIIWLSGWAAHESQQKPLKPGSAKAKLADALAKAQTSTP
jgi:SAM-dependent methyltransferase